MNIKYQIRQFIIRKFFSQELKATQDSYEDGYQDGKDDGYDEGYDDGVEDGSN